MDAAISNDGYDAECSQSAVETVMVPRRRRRGGPPAVRPVLPWAAPDGGVALVCGALRRRLGRAVGLGGTSGGIGFRAVERLREPGARLVVLAASAAAVVCLGYGCLRRSYGWAVMLTRRATRLCGPVGVARRDCCCSRCGVANGAFFAAIRCGRWTAAGSVPVLRLLGYAVGVRAPRCGGGARRCGRRAMQWAQMLWTGCLCVCAAAVRGLWVRRREAAPLGGWRWSR
jgi:hypothetical protein